MSDIFNKQIKTPQGAYSIDAAKLLFGNVAPGGLLIQNVNIQYQQQMSFLYDLSEPSAVYYVAGRAQGAVSVGKAVGNSTAFRTFYTKFGDVCNITSGDWSITGATGCTNSSGTTGSGSLNLTLKNPKVQSVGFAMSQESAIIVENVNAMFTNLEEV